MARFLTKKTMGLLAATALLAAGCDDDGGGSAQEIQDAATIRDAAPADAAGGGGAGGVGGGGGSPDMAVASPDMAVASPDMAVGEPDMAVAEPDMGGLDPDAAPPPPPMGDVYGGRINTLSIAGDPANQGCRDLNGDGRADNSLALAAALANDGLQGAVNDGDLNLLPTAIGLAPPGANGQFDLALLTGNPGGAGYIVSMSSLNADGSPRVIFGDTSVAGGALSAGPGNFPVDIPVGGMDLALDITNATISGTAGIDANGFFINNGVITGIIPHDALVAALANTDFAFAAGLLPPDVNGTGNSVCLLFSSQGVTLEGFPVE
ncbi:MAG: hypothetical protein H6706_24335 [Myxococcales bacterium]|nr:hypothetical protein [Myxococcales bacterium]